jgi:hypothetical protein
MEYIYWHKNEPLPKNYGNTYNTTKLQNLHKNIVQYNDNRLKIYTLYYSGLTLHGNTLIIQLL